MIHSNIILIGPMMAGKSTIAPILAERLGVERIEMDGVRWDYYKEIGYDEAEVSRISNSEEGVFGRLRYWKPFEAHAVERVVADHSNCVIDFGAGHSVYEDETLFARVQQALAPYPNVILLLPSPDLDESVKTVNARFERILQEEGIELNPDLLALNEHFVRHPSNQRLAKIVVYTEGKAAEETCEEIVGMLKEAGK